MRLTRIVAPSGPVVTLAEAKAHLRVDHDDDDGHITGCVLAAEGHLDGPFGTLGRCLVDQTWQASLAEGEAFRQPLIDARDEVRDDLARTVTFTAGFGGPEDVPWAIKAAILLHVGTLYQHRETQASSVAPTGAYEALLAPWRAWGG